jgi:hypothetical protein
MCAIQGELGRNSVTVNQKLIGVYPAYSHNSKQNFELLLGRMFPLQLKIHLLAVKRLRSRIIRTLMVYQRWALGQC